MRFTNHNQQTVHKKGSGLFTKRKHLLLYFMLLIINATSAQVDSTSTKVDLKYRRSSLYTLMLDDSTRQYADAIRAGYNGYLISEKFNNHNLDTRMIKSEAGVKDKKPFIDIFISNNHIARNLVAKWYNRSAKGGFNMDTIAARGSYNASELDAKIARSTKRGLSILQDAGVELISNTFLVVSDFEYMTMEEYLSRMKKTTDALSSLGGKLGANAKVFSDLNETVSQVTTGYVVTATTYLYQLEWNEEVEAIMYEQYWTEDGSVDAERVKAFDNSDIFHLKFIGKEIDKALVPQWKAANKSEEVMIGIATKRALDASIAKLQKKYEEFRIKTPMFTPDPVTAQIGLKEGIEKGDRFSVLEQRQDEDGRTYYKQIGTISVDGTQIWDNRFDVTAEEKQSNVNATLFKGGKEKYYSGLLIRQGATYSEKKRKPVSVAKDNKPTNQ